MLAFARVSREPLAIHCWAVFQFSIVRPTVSVRRERFAELAFALQFAHPIANVSQINCVCKEFVNRHAMTIQPVPISNSVKIMCARRRFDAVQMTIAYIMSAVLSIHMVDLSVKIRAKDDSYADGMQNVQLEITKDCVHANKDLSMTAKADATESNANVTRNVERINSVRRIFVNWLVKVVGRAVRKRFAQWKVTGPFAIVNRATVEMHMNSAKKWTIAETHLADREQFAIITKARSIALAAMDTLAIHITKDVDRHSNAKVMPTAHQVPNASNRIASQNAEMCVKLSAADRIPSVRQ